MSRRFAAVAFVVLATACGGDGKPSQAEIDAAVAKALETTTTQVPVAIADASSTTTSQAAPVTIPRTASQKPVVTAPVVSTTSTTLRPSVVVTSPTTTAPPPKLPVCVHPSEYQRVMNWTPADYENNHKRWKTAVESQGAVYATTSQTKPACQSPLDADLTLDKTCGPKPVPEQPHYPPNATLDQMRSINNNTRMSNEARQGAYDECQGWFYGYR